MTEPRFSYKELNQAAEACASGGPFAGAELHIDGFNLAAMLRQAAETEREREKMRGENEQLHDNYDIVSEQARLLCGKIDTLQAEVERLTKACDQAREIARRWHDTVRDIDGEFLSLKPPVLDELLHDAAIIASWNTPKEDTTEKE